MEHTANSNSETNDSLAVQTLSKEQQKALGIFQKYLAHIDYLMPLGEFLTMQHPILPTNYFAFSTSPFEKAQLPKDESWEWAQSNSRVTVTLGDMLITFRKLNTRRKCPNIRPPPLKIWLFEASSKRNNEIYFLWCEKGIGNSEGIFTEIGLIYPQFLRVEDFSFLRSFTDNTIANDLGW